MLLVLLLANIIYIGLVTIAQRRLDWMLGYSSVMHMGYIFLGIASANILGATGAAILMFAHGLSIALLFGITGEIRKRVPSLDFDAMGGLAKAMPLAAFAFGLGAFAAIGLPGFANFAAEIMVVFGAFQNGFDYQHFHMFQWVTVLALWGVVISAVYMLRAYRRTFFGSSAKSELVITDIRSGFRAPIGLLVAVSLLLGFCPQIAVDRLLPTFRNYFSATQ
jgi:NADH-quinone oxidoreductase subunit M